MRHVLTLGLLLALSGGAVLASDQAFETNERGLDRRNMDLSVSPCEDFYRYANGQWLERNPIPPDQSRWGTMSEMRERNYVVLRDILESAAASDASAGTNERKAGDFWRAAMDTEKIEKAGTAPLRADFERIEAMKGPADVVAFVRDMHREGNGMLFDVGVLQDLQNSDRYMFYATQGGLGLPDRDYYLRDGDEAQELRDAYVTHVARMLELGGEEPEVAATSARAILELETSFAETHLTRTELRDLSNYYNPQKVAAADEATPHFSWTAYFDGLGLQGLDSFSFAHPKFFAEMDRALAEVPIATWRSYLRWHLLDYAAPYLSQAFVGQNFDFYGRTLQGSEELRPRWKRVVDQTSNSLGEALGEVYVTRAFPPATKERADRMIADLEDVVRTRLTHLDWMSDETRQRALGKLDAFVAKIGYPDEWRDYSSLQIGTDSYLANVRAGSAFEARRDFDKIGQPIDRNEWGMPPQTINAYYNPVQNEIVFPAAIMQPPFFDGEIDDAVNYGGMGGVIGHELMHGFDDQGSRFDADGNMKSWWTDEDRARFEERTAKLVEQYNGFVAVDDLHVNGQLTLGENIGDLAGLTMAYYALEQALEGKEGEKIDGFTPEQRFFLSWAQGWRYNYRPEALKLQVNTDPHSPPRFRTNGPMANLPEFAAAFGCKEGDPMVLPPDKRAEIW